MDMGGGKMKVILEIDVENERALNALYQHMEEDCEIYNIRIMYQNDKGYTYLVDLNEAVVGIDNLNIRIERAEDEEPDLQRADKDLG